MDSNNNNNNARFWAVFFLICVIVFGFYRGWFGLSGGVENSPNDLPPISIMDDALDFVATVEYVATTAPTQRPTQAIATMEPVIQSTVPSPTVPQPTRDWTPELTAVSRNLENAVNIVEQCALAKAKAATEFRVLNCQPSIDNLELAKQKQRELQEYIKDNS